LRLQSPRDLALAGHRGQGHLPEERDVSRRVLLDLALECRRRRFDLDTRQKIRSRGRARDGGGEATSVSKHRAVVFGTKQLRGKAGQMNDAPEAIASAREMMSRRGGEHARIDAAENDR